MCVLFFINFSWAAFSLSTKFAPSVGGQLHGRNLRTCYDLIDISSTNILVLSSIRVHKSSPGRKGGFCFPIRNDSHPEDWGWWWDGNCATFLWYSRSRFRSSASINILDATISTASEKNLSFDLKKKELIKMIKRLVLREKKSKKFVKIPRDVRFWWLLYDNTVVSFTLNSKRKTPGWCLT